MEKFAHVRIDDRLIHGQIIASWLGVIHCTTIVVADDKAAKDSLQSMMLQMACPSSITLKIVPIDEAKTRLVSPAIDRAKTLLILRNAESALRLTETDIGIDEINVGNVSSAAGRKKYSKSVWLNDADIAAFTALHDRGIRLEVRIVPSDKGTDLVKMMQK